MDKYFLLIFQIMAHLAIVPLVIYGEPIHYILSLLVYFFTGCFGMTMTYHRGLAHKSWKMPKWFSYFGTLCGFYGLTGSSIAWVAIHRQHHKYSDTDKDPHSPKHKGFLRAQFLSMFEPVHIKYVVDLLKSDFHKSLHSYYFLIHAAIMVFWGWIDPMLLVSCYLVPAAILWNAGSGINTIGHMFGYKSHETNDDSMNNIFLGYFMWGEGWHNNHHFKPNKSQFNEKWWEIDVGGWFIKRLQMEN